MADIFLSYASSDRERARVLAEALGERGLKVWWDRTIPPGRVFDEVIQEALQTAKCVVVLWSGESVRSNWVKTEAAEGLAQGKLVPALIESVAPPIEFKRIQAADLSDWSGASDHPELRKLLAAVEHLLKGNASTGSAASRTPVAPARAPSKLTLLKLMTVLGLVGIIGTVAVRWIGERVKQGMTPDGQTQPMVPAQPQVTPPSPTQTQSESESTPATTGSSTVAPGPPATAARTNLLSPSEGGEIVTASNERWNLTIDGKEDTYAWVDSGEAVFGFKDGRAASFDNFAVLVPSANDNNLRDFELLIANEPGGPFQSIGIFATQNVRIMKNPYQEFRFAPVTAKYLKVRALKSHSGGDVAIAHEFRLYGSLE